MVKYKELSFGIKVGVVGGWIAIIIYVLAFLIGFMEGLA